MEQYIKKSALVAEIKKRIKTLNERLIKHPISSPTLEKLIEENKKILSFLDSIEVKGPYEQFIQYPSREDGIKAHAEDYSWNIESELFQQLTLEQQKLWRKEIEQACISGGYSGLNLARDPRYKENLEVKEVDLDRETTHYLLYEHRSPLNEIMHKADLKAEMQYHKDIEKAFKAGFKLGMQVSNKAQKGE